MFKKIILILALVLFAAFAYAEGTVVQSGDSFIKFGPNMQAAIFTITSDGGSVPLTDFLDANRNTIFGSYIMSVEMYSATDDAFTVTITTALGSTLFEYTTTAATTGHIKNATDRWPIYSVPKIDVTGLATTEICTVIVTFVR